MPLLRLSVHFALSCLPRAKVIPFSITFLREDGLIFERLLKYFGTQNFARIATNFPEITILRNEVSGRRIYCVLADNTRTMICSGQQLLSIKQILTDPSNANTCCAEGDLLFIVVTGDTLRDRGLTSLDLNIWLVDNDTGTLLVYENQPDDFYGLRHGIESDLMGEFSDGMFEFGTGGRQGTRSNGTGGSGTGGSGVTSGSNTSRVRRNVPIVTICLIILNVVYYIILSANGNVNDTAYMLQMGANYGPLVFQHFEIWRLVVSMFMHFSLLHLGSNMLYLAIAGYNLEKVCGHIRFFIIYMLAGIGGNVVSAAFYSLKGTSTISGGASGAIYGLIGGIALLTFISFRKLKPTLLFARIGILLIFVFYSSIAKTGVDGAAHIGGFFFGILLTFLFVIGGRKNER